MERYRIIYVWKILEGYAPNCGLEIASENQRLGRKCKVPSLVTNGRKAIQTLREACFQTNGPRLFNCLPKYIREIRKDQEEFKTKLDIFLSSIPDEPRLGRLVPTAVCKVTANQSNSLLAWTNDAWRPKKCKWPWVSLSGHPRPPKKKCLQSNDFYLRWLLYKQTIKLN